MFCVNEEIEGSLEPTQPKKRSIVNPLFRALALCCFTRLECGGDFRIPAKMCSDVSSSFCQSLFFYPDPCEANAFDEFEMAVCSWPTVGCSEFGQTKAARKLFLLVTDQCVPPRSIH